MNNVEGALEEVFQKKLEMEHERFDEKESLLVERLAKKGYHTSLEKDMIHTLNASIEYAAALLYNNPARYRERALAIIGKVLSMQDTDSNSPTYGIWPYFLEEPFEKMKAPDWNWADFIGKVLVHLLMDHKSAIPSGLAGEIEASLYHAAASIKRRNIGPDYTNISLMGAFVTIKAGELINNADLFDYGKRRLQKEVEFVKANGGFSEYNCPSYTVLALEELGRMMKYFHDSDCLKAAAELNEIGWAALANHFHSPTLQLSAPNSRAFSNIIGKHLVSFIHIGTGMKLNLAASGEMQVKLLWNQIVIRCPQHYDSYFEPIKTPRFIKETFYKGMDTISDDEIRVLIEKGTPELTAATYMNPHFSLGTFSLYDFWNQRRPLMAYWGTADQCAYLRLRCLHDGQDYCSAMISASQVQNHVVAGVYFVKDHGDYHFILDPIKEGKIKAKQLLLRFELGGAVGGLHLPEKIAFGEEVEIKTGTVDIRFNPMFGIFDGEQVTISSGKDGSSQWVDIILYEGAEKTLDFNRMDSAAFVFGLSLFDREFCLDDGSSFSCEMDREGQTMKASLNGTGIAAEIEIPLKPTNYIRNPGEELVRRVKCGGFIYEQE